MRSRIGRAFVAMRDGEIAAESLRGRLAALQGDSCVERHLCRHRGRTLHRDTELRGAGRLDLFQMVIRRR
jgi:hypothetical protein